MRDDDKTDLPGWLGLKRSPDFDKARWLGSALSVVVIVLFGMAVLVVFAVLGHALFGLGMDDVPRIGFGTGAVAVALIGAPFVIWRSVVGQKTLNVTEQGHITDRINTAVQGLGAEKTVKVRDFVPLFKKENGKLKKDKDGNPIPLLRANRDPQGRWEVSEETQPNLEVRIGAIYALERIAQDSDRDHVQIMEILCAYIRQNAPAPAEDDWPELEMYEGEDDGPLDADWRQRLQTFSREQIEKKATLKLREDIQTALTVIGRRSAKQRRLEAGRGEEAPFPFDIPCPDYDGPDEDHDPAPLNAYRKKLDEWQGKLDAYEGYWLDLRGADLRGADLAQRDLKGAKLTGTHLQGADLRQARLQGADLEEARLEGANFMEARLPGANLEFATLQGANLMGARLPGANLEFARLQGAHVRKARLEGARLMEVRLQGARLGTARLQGADLERARLQGADIGGTRLQGANLGEARLQGARLRQARLQRADLEYARLQGANFMEAQLQEAKLELAWMDNKTQLAGATLRGAAARFVDYTDVPHIAAHLDDMFGDATVTLPGGHGPEHESWPAHWPKFDLGDDFAKQWHAWQRDPETYRRPDPPKREDTA